jgi:surface protein
MFPTYLCVPQQLALERLPILPRTPTRTSTKGATLTEYGMLAGLIVLLGIATVYGMGSTVQNVYCIVTEAVSGEEGSCLDVAANPGEGDGGGGGGGGGDGGGGDTEPPPPPPVTGMVLRYEGNQAVFTIHDSTPGDVVVDWGDGTTSTYAGVGNFTFVKNFATNGPHTVIVDGTAELFQSGSPTQLREVVSFGDLGWTSLHNAFVHHDVLDAVAPLPATVTTLTGTFLGADGVLAGLENWNVAQVTTFEDMFRNAGAFNRPITAWNTENATSMARMFSNAASFNQPIGAWNTANVTTMAGAFAGASAFNQDLSGWDTSNVTLMDTMFQGASAFNGNITEWDVSRVVQPSAMNNMFLGATAFAQNLSGWCVPTITYRPLQFANGSAIQGEPVWGYCGAPEPGEAPMRMTITGTNASFTIFDTLPSDVLVDWGDGTTTPYTTATSQTFTRNYGSAGTRTITVSGTFSRFRSNSTTSLVSVDSFGRTGVTNLSNAFQGHTALASLAPLPDTVTNLTSTFQASTTSVLAGVENWYTGNVTTLNNTFNGAAVFNRAIGGWDTSKVTDMTNTFSNTGSFNQNLDWDTARVANMEFMFANATQFNGDISGWNVRGVTAATNMRAMFQGANAFRGNLSEWCVEAITTRPSNFATTDRLAAEPVWGYCGAPEPSADSMQLTFVGTTAGVRVHDSTPGDVVVHWGDGSSTPYNPGANNTTFNRTYATSVPGGYTVRVSGTFNRIEVIGGNANLTAIPTFGNTGLTSLQGAFNNTHALASVAALPSTVTDLTNTFTGSQGSLVGVESWNVANVTTMQSLFQNTSTFNRDLGGWNVANVTNFAYMFQNAPFFNRDLPWNTASATNMSGMFTSAIRFNGNIADWDTADVPRLNMSAMFQGATAFRGNLSGWCTTLSGTRPFNFAALNQTQFIEPSWGSCPP